VTDPGSQQGSANVKNPIPVSKKAIFLPDFNLGQIAEIQ
jgi:hypothetical protein